MHSDGTIDSPSWCRGSRARMGRNQGKWVKNKIWEGHKMEGLISLGAYKKISDVIITTITKKYFSYHRCIHMLSAPLLAGQVGLESVKEASESLEPGEGAPLHRRTSPCHPPFLDDLWNITSRRRLSIKYILVTALNIGQPLFLPLTFCSLSKSQNHEEKHLSRLLACITQVHIC